ncbi:hypothetical protein PINS_up021249 [Pythium insidiosum]|nr:hypothetical protein PINS_up021249 [Pythium insidiosum]
MTSDSEINANIVDSEKVMTPDGIPASKLARDFRVRKFMEMTGRSYDEIDGMRFLDAANTLDVAANDPTTILDVLEVHEELSFRGVHGLGTREDRSRRQVLDDTRQVMRDDRL